LLLFELVIPFSFSHRIPSIFRKGNKKGVKPFALPSTADYLDYRCEEIITKIHAIQRELFTPSSSHLKVSSFLRREQERKAQGVNMSGYVAFFFSISILIIQLSSLLL
jgi:hypothetical protein